MSAKHGPTSSIWGVWTRRRTRRQALTWAGVFLVVGIVGLLTWQPLAIAGLVAAGATVFNVMLGATRDG